METVKASLTIAYNGTDTSVALPSERDGVVITWSLRDPSQSSIVDVSTGEVTRPVNENVTIVLVATLAKGSVTDSKEFSITVRKADVFADGDGTPGNPYVIADADQLNRVREHLDAHFVLDGNIDLNVAPFHSGSGWEPIGTFDQPFTGTFDGNGMIIRGFTINGGDLQQVGLFGSISGNAEIRDLSLENAKVNSAGNVGALVGYMQGGVIESVSVQGTVDNHGGHSYTGGLVGRMSAGSELIQVSANVTISGFGYVGGLVGANEGLIEQSFARGELEANFMGIGGLVGINFGEVHQSYSVTEVTGGTVSIGGLVGENDGIVTESYAAGKVDTSAADKGGLIGTNNGTVSTSFYDSETTGQNDSDKGTPFTTEQMKLKETYSDWTDSVWTIQDGSYPSLRWE